MTAKQLRRGNWSVQELERLRQLLPRRGVAATAALLRRSAESVQRKAQGLLRVPPRRGDWTASDDAVLREAWGAVDARLLALMTGRTPAEVKRRGSVLRAKPLAGPWTPADLRRLKELYGTRSDADLEVCLQRTRGEIVAMADRLCLAKDKRFTADGRGDQHAMPGTEAARARMPRWTSTEVEQLRRLYADHDNLVVARQLRRTVTGVANKAHQLGLHKSPALLASIGRDNVASRYRVALGAEASGG